MHQTSMIEKTIKLLLSEFRERTRALACSILDKDGFILLTEKESFDDNIYDKFLISFSTYVEFLIKRNKDSYFFEKTQTMIITYGSNKKISFLIKSINDDLYFVSVHPLLIKTSSCVSEFDRIIKEIQSYLSED